MGPLPAGLSQAFKPPFSSKLLPKSRIQPATSTVFGHFHPIVATSLTITGLPSGEPLTPHSEWYREYSMIKSHLFLGAAAFAVAISVASPAIAQGAPTAADESSDTAASGETIVVTGSRIARANFDTVEPSVVVQSTDIEARGFETLGQALNEQPSFGVPGNSPIGAQSGLGQGQSFVNFLGLGSQRTLTLVNGRRFVSSNTSSIFGPTGAGSQVDLNIIPTKLLDRIETIAVGGAPIYGADAISGTINVILKQDYEGLEIDGQYGISDRGDGQNYRVRALAGQNFGDGRGNITFAGEYNKSKGLTGVDRSFYSSGLFFGNASDPTSIFSQELYRDRRIPAISDSGIPMVGGDFIPLSPEQELLFFGTNGLNFGVQNASGAQLRFDENGNLIPIDFGRYAGAPGSFGVDFEGGNGFSLVPTTNLLSETRRYSAILTTKYELTDSVRFFGEAWYSNSKGRNLRDQPVYNSALFANAGDADGNLIMSVDNPFLTPAARAAIIDAINNNPLSDLNSGAPSQDYFYLARANTDLATGNSTGEVEVMRFVGGFDGSFDLLAGTWNWEVVGNYGRSKTTSESREIIQQNFLNAIDAVAGPGGTITCRAGVVNSPFPSINPNCTPINLFGTGRNSQAALDYITAIANPRSINKQKDFTASLSGPLFKLPGGDFSIAIGYEHREESQKFDPGAFFYGADDPDPLTDENGDGDPTNDRVPYGRSVPILPVNGKFNTDEISGEFLAQIISPSTDSFIDLLEVKGAVRYVDHSLAGSDWTWTLGGRLGIVPDFTIRGNFTRAIRAPAITELFNPSSTFFGFAVDPCDQANLGNGPAPTTRQANCAADGLPANFSSLSNSASFLQAIEGNPVLKNEKADSWTIGAVFAPSFIPRLRASVDWVDIKLTDAITDGGAGTILANCYDSTDFPNAANCARFTRDASGQIDFVEVQYLNLADMRYKGLLGSVDYRVPTPFLGAESQVSFSLSYQYMDELSTRADPGSARTQQDGGIGYSKHKGVLTVNYTEPSFGVFTQLSYIGKAKIDPEVADDYYPDGLNNLPSVVFVNVGANVSIADRFDLHFTVDNLFDKQPPYPYPASGGSITYFRGVLGRYFRLGASVSF